jgi:hypothetical protein
MSVVKSFVVDSTNFKSGALEIDRNYFNKVPNAIRLVNFDAEIETEVLNDSNNKMNVEKLDANGKITGSVTVNFPPQKNISSYADFITFVLNPNLKAAMQTSGLFNGRWLEFSYADGVFYLTQYSDINVNFAVDDSIGDLLGFGRKRKAGPKSENIIVDLTKVDNIDLTDNSWLYLNSGTNSDTKKLIEIPSGFQSDEELARILTNKINQEFLVSPLPLPSGTMGNVGQLMELTYGIGTVGSRIICSYVNTFSQIVVASNLNIPNFTMTDAPIVLNGQTFRVPYNFVDEIYNFELVNSEGVTMVNTVNSELTDLKFGDLVLRNLTTQKNLNGVYVINENGEVGSRYAFYNGAINTSLSPKLGDFVFVRHNKVYRNSDVRGGYQYDNKIFVLTQAPNQVEIDVSELFFTEFDTRAIPYYIDFYFPLPLNVHNSVEFIAGKTDYQYGVIRDSLDGQNPSNNGVLKIGTPGVDEVYVQVGDTLLIPGNGIFTCVNNGSNLIDPWRLERSNYLDNVIVDINYTINPLIINENENTITSIVADNRITYNSTDITYGQLIYWNGKGVYKCIDDGSNTGLSSKYWSLQRVHTGERFLYDDGVNPYHIFVTTRHNSNKKLRMYKLTTDIITKYYNNNNDKAKALEKIVNITNNYNLTPFYQEENLYRPYGNVVNFIEDKSGKFKFEFVTAGTPGPNFKPTFSLEFFSNSLGYSNSVKKGETTYLSIIDVNSSLGPYGSFNILIPNNPLKSYQLIPVNGISNTNDLVELINSTIASETIRVRYDGFNKTYIFYSPGIFNLDFTITNSVGKLLGFSNINLSGFNSYNGVPIDSLEEVTKPNSIYICSDLVDSIDSGSIIPLGGPVPVENVMFVVPNVRNYNETGTTEVLINNSAFAQKFNDNKFVNDKIPIKFWLKLPGGIGFVKKSWNMRCELIFKTVGEI